jgi:hypothetical protein
MNARTLGESEAQKLFLGWRHIGGGEMWPKDVAPNQQKQKTSKTKKGKKAKGKKKVAKAPTPVKLRPLPGTTLLSQTASNG